MIDLGLKEVKVLGNGIVLFRKLDNELCGKKVIKVSKVVTSINDLSDHEVAKYLKTYFNSMNLGFPIEVKSIFTPLSKEKVISELNRRIQNLLVDLEVNPNNVKAKTELEKLNKLKDKIVKHGIQPYDLVVFYVVEACSASEDEVVNTLNSRAGLLMKTLESLGIITSELRGIEGKALLQIFFRGFPTKLNNLILTLLRLRYSFRTASPILALFTPHIINARTRFDLRNQGIYLGYSLITFEEIFWNVSNCLNPHVLVLGPSGIGKTETLITLLLRTYLTYSTRAYVIDVKNEYVSRLLTRGFKPQVINLGVGIGLGIADLLKYIPKNLRAVFLTELISDSMILRGDRELTAALFKVLNEATELQDEISSNYFWDVVKDLTLGIDDEYTQYRLTRIFNTIETLERGAPLIEVLSNPELITVINLSHISTLGADYLNLSIATFFNVINLLYMSAVRESHIPRVQVVIDEAWQFMFNKAPLLLKLIKLGRSYGVSIALATQSLNDLSELSKDLIENIGLFIALPSSDLMYWKELSNYMRISYDEIKDYTLLLSKGDALIRILPDPRPIPVKLDHEV